MIVFEGQGDACVAIDHGEYAYYNNIKMVFTDSIPVCVVFLANLVLVYHLRSSGVHGEIESTRGVAPLSTGTASSKGVTSEQDSFTATQMAPKKGPISNETVKQTSRERKISTVTLTTITMSLAFFFTLAPFVIISIILQILDGMFIFFCC